MSNLKANDERFMRRALELAQQAWGQTHPNPMVGAVIVEASGVVAEGWHASAGQAHAEVAALKALGRKPAAGASIYATLEPCSTCGRTGACTNALIEAGFERVVIGAKDPNPEHAGRGLEILREASIEVVEGVLAEECADLNLIFNHWITQRSPFVAAKMAITLDGKFAAASGDSKWVTGETARADVMRWRRYFPAIAVSANTVLKDNPSLSSRIGDEVWCPQRFVFDRTLMTFEAETLPQIYTDTFASQTTVLCADAASDHLRARAEDLNIRLWQLPEARGHLDWLAFRKRCAEAGICGVYVEVGPRLATQVIECGLADYLFVYQAPKLLSDASAPGIGSLRNSQSMEEAFALRDLRQANFEGDRLIRGFLLK